jgi:hypothetical protein
MIVGAFPLNARYATYTERIMHKKINTNMYFNHQHDFKSESRFMNTNRIHQNKENSNL